MNFLPEEEVLYDNKNLGLTLTTHRVRAEWYLYGYYFLKSIMLEKVASVAITRVSYPSLLLLSVLFFMGCVAPVGGNGNLFLFLISLMLFIGYFITIRIVVEIASCGAVIRINIPLGIDMKEVKQLIEILEDAKDARYTIGRQD